ncbi:OmpA family protein [Primorskyibacter aestuariivivens]|uniref:OmpA family protein n=1 Tax=Primorskyibacter aestuariivivens TaxID=1888912 RepID=UPI002301EA0C|nr:OmpA family protein [Primorskyibacter aestuariivivens]MDA7428402.1 OmpA family protein [Primorskyibacter aestuariivivens]
MPLSVLAFVLSIGTASADTVIPLEEKDIGRTGGNDLERCLRGDATCDDGGVDFTLDDVINLGIVDHEEVAETPASESDTPRNRTDPLPSVDLNVVFDYKSTDIRPDQMGQLLDLAQVLRGEDFANVILVFMGHTDAKGSESYNLDLSRRRAESVAAFVGDVADIPNHRIRTKGFGFSQLADPANPLSERNRRVQLLLIPGGA